MCGIVWILLFNVLMLTGAITSFQSSSIFTSSVKELQAGTLNTLNSTSSVIASFSPAIQLAFTSVKKLVNDSVDATGNSIDFNALSTTGLTPNMIQLATGLETTQANQVVIVGIADAIAANKTAVSSQVASLVTSIKAINAAIVLWSSTLSNVPSPSVAGLQYRLTATVSTGQIVSTADSAQANIDSSPDGSSTFASLASAPNLATFATEIRTLIDGIQANIAKAIRDGGASVKATSIPALDTAQAQAINTITSFSDPLQKTLSSTYKSADDAFLMVIQFDDYRNYGVWGLSAVVVIVLVVMAFTMCHAKPSRTKGCNFCANPIYMLIQIFAVLFFIMALILGDTCSALFENTNTLAKLGSTGTTISQALSVKNSCTNGESILQAAIRLNLVSGDGSNLTKLAQGQIEGIDFSSVATGFDLSSQINLSGSPTSKLSVLTSIDLSSLNVTALGTLQNTTLVSLKTQLSTLATDLATLRSALVSGQLTFSAAQNGADENNAVTNLQSRILTTITNINGLTVSGTGTIDILGSAVFSLANNILSVKEATTTLINNANLVPGYYTTAIASLNTFANQSVTNVHYTNAADCSSACHKAKYLEHYVASRTNAVCKYYMRASWTERNPTSKWYVWYAIKCT